MLNFDLYTPTKIYFGRGRTDEVGAAVAELGAKKPLVYYGGGSAVRTGLLTRIERSLEAAGIEYVELGGVRPNPTAQFSAYTANFARENGCDMILAVGGGSVIDSAKMAAYCVHTCYEPWDITTKKVVPAGRIPLGVVLTIAATGSETSNSAVLTHDGLKRGFSSDLNRPDFAIMDPELTYTLPAYQTACGVVDILMHTFERYMCANTDNVLIDNLAEGLSRAVIDAGRAAMARPDDYEARATLMFAGSLSHNGLMGAGRACGMWAHKLEQEYDTCQEAHRSRHPGRNALLSGHVYSGDEQRPYARRYHNARGKAQQKLLQPRAHLATQQKYAASTKRSPGQRYQNADQSV